MQFKLTSVELMQQQSTNRRLLSESVFRVLQVVDRKGWRASYPKIIMATPYQDSMFTDGAGAELQKILEHSPCVGSDRERQSMQLEGSPGTLFNL